MNGCWVTDITFYGPPTQAGIEAANKIGVTDSTSAHISELIPESEDLLKYIQDNSDELLNRWNAYAGG
jgi:hypothetical protein